MARGTNKLWPEWRQSGAELDDAKRDATLLAIKEQEDAGIDIVTDGEQARQHFVHGFLERIEGIDFAHKVEMGIRNDRYKAMVPVVTGPLRLTGRVHEMEARHARAHTHHKLKFTLPGPMTIVDTIADTHYGDKVTLAMAFAELLNQEARALQADGVDVIQFDEPAFNVYMDEVAAWGIDALHRAIDGPDLHHRRAYLLRLRHQGQHRLEDHAWRRVAAIRADLSRPWRAAGSIRSRWNAQCQGAAPADGIARGQGCAGRRHRRCLRSDRNAGGRGRDHRGGDAFVPPERLFPCTNCGMAPMRRDIALAKLAALGQGAALARRRLNM